MSHAGTRDEREPVFEKGIRYSLVSSLNTLQTCVLDPSADKSTTFWIIYIHGGAWRDPSIDATSFDDLQSLILASDVRSKIFGLASINYRLSAYPSHRTDPSRPGDPARTAKHPDHINDVLDAIHWLQHMYHFGNRYVLVGHSCGATLAFQVAMARDWSQWSGRSGRPSPSTVTLPLGIVGVEGIYDIPALLETYKHVPAYAEFIRNAFGDNPETWHNVSPTNADFVKSWPTGLHASLVHSDGDELLDRSQLELMKTAFVDGGWCHSGDHRISIEILSCLKHDEVWQKPEQLANIVIEIIRGLERI